MTKGDHILKTRSHKVMVKRPLDSTVTARIDLGDGRGVFDIPHEVAVYIDELYQEGAAIHTRVASKQEVLKHWLDRTPPKILSIASENRNV